MNAGTEVHATGHAAPKTIFEQPAERILHRTVEITKSSCHGVVEHAG